MSSTFQKCRIVNIPGTPGTGTAGANGTNGLNAWGSLTATFTMPAQGGTGVAVLDTTAWMAIGEPVFIETIGTLIVEGISGNNVTLSNPQDGVGLYASNATPGTHAVATSRVTPTGFETGSGQSLTPAQIAASIFRVMALGGAQPPADGSVQALFVWDSDSSFLWVNSGTFPVPVWNKK